jgi:hypothetical protein
MHCGDSLGLNRLGELIRNRVVMSPAKTLTPLFEGQDIALFHDPLTFMKSCILKECIL